MALSYAKLSDFVKVVDRCGLNRENKQEEHSKFANVDKIYTLMIRKSIADKKDKYRSAKLVDDRKLFEEYQHSHIYFAPVDNIAQEDKQCVLRYVSEYIKFNSDKTYHPLYENSEITAEQITNIQIPRISVQRMREITDQVEKIRDMGKK